MIKETAYLAKKTLNDLEHLLDLPVKSDRYKVFLEMYVMLNDIMSETSFEISNNELFGMFIDALVQQGMETRTAIKNMEQIIPLLRIIELEAENTQNYKMAHKTIHILTSEKPSFWKQVFNLKG